jgi:RNA polymerase sigma factor (sigma-70 family)
MMNEEEIVRTYADMVYKIAYRYVANPTDADDVFSETFLAYFKKERTFEEEEHRKAWLIRVTINCAKDLLRSKAPWEELNEEILVKLTIDGEAKEIKGYFVISGVGFVARATPENQHYLDEGKGELQLEFMLTENTCIDCVKK